MAVEDLQSLISTYSKSRGLARFTFVLEAILEALDSVARSGDGDSDADAGLGEGTFRLSAVDVT